MLETLWKITKEYNQLPKNNKNLIEEEVKLNDLNVCNICLTNKIFTYLLAGLPVIMSKTPAQEELASKLSEAAILVDIEKSVEVAKILDDFFCDPQKLFDAKEKACKLVKDRYNWDFERQAFLGKVNKTLEI